MFASIRQFFTPPVFPEDEGKTRRTALLNAILLFIIAVLVIANLVSAWVNYLINQTPDNPTNSLVGIVIMMGAYILLRRGNVQFASIVFILSNMGVILAAMLTSNGIRNPAVAGLAAVVVIASLLLGENAALIFAGLSIFMIFGVNYASVQRLLDIPVAEITSTYAGVTYTTVLVAMAVLLRLAAQSISKGLAETRRKEVELRELAATLEQRVADRTRALANSAEVSRRLSTILDPNQLVLEVVEQVKSAFNYYHAHIYLLDDSGQTLKMAGGTGAAGREMLASGHAIPIERGLVGRAAQTNAPVFVPDTASEPGWLPNPLLPETTAEIAVPITIGETVLGVLDVQHNIVNGLTQEDATLLQSIANQVAVAIQNARQYEQAREREVALSVSEERYRLFIQYSGEAIYELDFETKKIQNANQALLNLLGYELEEMRALKLYDIVAFGPDKVDIVLDRVKKDKSLLVGETKWKRKDGTLVDVYVNMSAVQQGSRTFMLGQAFDISQRKQIQLALEKRAERDRVLNRISIKIRNAVSVEQILQVATQEMRQATGAARSVVKIEPNEETVSMRLSPGENPNSGEMMLSETFK